MKKIGIIPVIFLIMLSCQPIKQENTHMRNLVDTIGFANNATKMDSVMQRIRKQFSGLIEEKRRQNQLTDSVTWKTVICPHDDYAYANYLYPLCLQNVKAKTVILLGVAHKARNFNLENKLVFDTFTHWKSAYGPVTISPLRKAILQHLDTSAYVIHDSMQMLEHSLEAIVPFLQYYNRSVEIVPVLVPYMSYSRIQELGSQFASALNQVVTEQYLNWGTDFALVISTDAVHYGDQNWGDSNFAFMGADSSGYEKATNHELEIISTSLAGPITPDKIKRFSEYTVQPNDYKQYQWTWCGRYSVPLGLMVSYELSRLQNIELNGQLLDYSTSIAHKNPDFSDIGMGVTAVANIHHWVGYAAIGYQ